MPTPIVLSITTPWEAIIGRHVTLRVTIVFEYLRSDMLGIYR